MPEICWRIYHAFQVVHGHACILHTYSIDKYTWQDQIEHIEHGPPPDPDMIMS